MEEVLKIENLTKYYGKNPGIIDVGFSVEKGEIFGFIGPNGAGKSTTIRTIMGLIKADRGRIELFGRNVGNDSSAERLRIGFMPSELNYYRGLTVAGLLKYSASFYGNGSETRITRYCDELNLEPSRKISELSLGNKRKVGIVQALIHKPDLLILDEPTSGLDPLIQSRFHEILRRERDRGCTVFFSSHTLSEVERLCRRVAIIKNGRIINSGSIDELKPMHLKKFRLRFEGGRPSENALGGALELKFEGQAVEGLYKGDIRRLMRNIGDMDITDAVIEDPGLEEVFMHYYSDEQEGVGES